MILVKNGHIGEGWIHISLQGVSFIRTTIHEWYLCKNTCQGEGWEWILLKSRVICDCKNIKVFINCFCLLFHLPIPVEVVNTKWLSFICGNKMPTRCNRWFSLQILLLVQHVSGTTTPIIRSSRVLYRWLLPVVFGALVFKFPVPNTRGSIHLYNTLELLMMGIVVPQNMLRKQ